MMKNANKELSSEQCEELLGLLSARFEKNMNRHQGLTWTEIQAKLETKPEKLWSLNEMEKTGGEPDVVGYDQDRKDTSFVIARPKVRTAVEMFVMIAKDWWLGRNINRRIAPLIWRPPWALSF